MTKELMSGLGDKHFTSAVNRVKRLNIDRECDVAVAGAGTCSFNTNVRIVYDECYQKNNANDP